MSERPGDPANDPELSALADGLRALAPRPAALDRGDLLFRAGRASAPRRWPWALATAACASLSLALGGTLLLRPPRTVERVVYVAVEPPPAVRGTTPQPPVELSPAPVPPEALAPAPLARHRHLQDHLLRWGLDGLGEPSRASEKPLTVAELLKAL